MFYALYGVFYNNFSLNLYTAIKLEELQKVNEASEKEASAVREELHNVKKQYEQVKINALTFGFRSQAIFQIKTSKQFYIKRHDKCF